MTIGDAPSIVIGDDFGISPEVQSRLNAAAQLCRQALAEVEAAYEVAEDGSDAEQRCGYAIEELEGVLWSLEWAPPTDD
jgi:hypothetical protein